MTQAVAVALAHSRIPAMWWPELASTAEDRTVTLLALRDA